MDTNVLTNNQSSKNINVYYYIALAGLSFSHLITALWWINWNIWDYFRVGYFRANCYSFFQSCTSIAFEETTPIKIVLGVYLVLSLSVFFLLYFKKEKIFYFVFIILFLIKTVLFLSRYNLMGNYHTMHLALIVVFLLSSQISFFYRMALCFQYFGAGTLKLNLEWMSGAALLKYPGFFYSSFYLWTISYVVILELLICWGLLFKNVTVRRITLIQLVIFHLYSYFIVGAFYPLIMLGLLLPVIIEDVFDFNYKPVKIKDFIQFQNWPVVLFLLVFIIYNGSVKFIAMDPSKDGAVRSLTLNMLDAKLVCNTKLIQKFENGNLKTLNLPPLDSAVRVRCDALVYESYLKNLCDEISKDEIKSKLYFHLETRRYTEEKFETVRSTSDVCKK